MSCSVWFLVSGLGLLLSLKLRLQRLKSAVIGDAESLARERFEGEGIIVRKGKKVYHRVKA